MNYQTTTSRAVVIMDDGTPYTETDLIDSWAGLSDTQRTRIKGLANELAKSTPRSQAGRC